MWFKLTDYGASSKTIQMITSMYESAKLCVKKYSKLSDFFNSNAGVKQGEPLSPFLFLMYINDVFEHLKTGIEVDFDQLSIFIHIFDR